MLVVAQRACRLQTRCRREGLSSTDQHLDCSLPCLAGGHREKVKLDNPFFEKPIVHSLYEYPARHWELDGQGQPTQRMIKAGRQAKFITPIPKFRKRKDSAIQQLSPIFGDGAGLSNREQRYDPTGIINKLRPLIDQWRLLPNPSDWLVSPETTRLLQHWRYHQFNNHRPFFCQVEAVETAIRLAEVAPKPAEANPSSNTSPIPTTMPIPSLFAWSFSWPRVRAEPPLVAYAQLQERLIEVTSLTFMT